MENTLNNLESKHLTFKLGEEQREALLSVFSFITNEDKFFTLCGSAGTGKSTIALLIIEFLKIKKIPYQLVAPTHKSKRVLRDMTGESVITIHQLLSLKPTIDVLDLDLNDLRFTSSTLSDSVPANGVLIIDECSMINDELYDFIVESCNDKKCKILFLGDIRQIEPVKQKSLAKPFKIDNRFELSKIYRQSNDNPLRDLLAELRKKPKAEFNSFESDKGSLIVYDDWHPFIKRNIDLFREAIITQNPEYVKILAYTNKRVEAFNRVIRDSLFDHPKEFEFGEFLTGYDNCEFNPTGMTITNSNDYQIQSAYETHTNVEGLILNGWLLRLYDFETESINDVFVLSKNNDKDLLEKLAFLIEDIRTEAIRCKDIKAKRMLWKRYYKITGSFITSFDLKYDDRVIKKKSIDYGYALSVHKSQGSTYDTVMVDMGNIMKCLNKIELRQLQYVAMSRTRKNILLLN